MTEPTSGGEVLKEPSLGQEYPLENREEEDMSKTHESVGEEIPIRIVKKRKKESEVDESTAIAPSPTIEEIRDRSISLIRETCKQ